MQLHGQKSFLGLQQMRCSCLVLRMSEHGLTDLCQRENTQVWHIKLQYSISVSWKERIHLSTFQCSKCFTCCVKSVYKIYFPTSKPIAREEKTTQDVNRGKVILCGVEWVRGSNKFVRYTSFNKGLHQKFPQHLGSVWEAFLLADTEQRSFRKTQTPTERTQLHHTDITSQHCDPRSVRNEEGTAKTKLRVGTVLAELTS